MTTTGLDPKVLERTRRAMAAKEGADKRSAICACGHPTGKHQTVGGRTICNGLKATCRCTDMVSVVKAPNARVFAYRTDEAGHAVIKGVLKTNDMGLGHRIEWMIELKCLEPSCGSLDDVEFVPIDGGRSNTLLCGKHR